LQSGNYDPMSSPVLLIGSKSDLNEQRAVSFEEGQQQAHKWKCTFMEVSAKNNQNIEDAFILLASQVLELEWGDGAGPRPNYVPPISVLPNHIQKRESPPSEEPQGETSTITKETKEETTIPAGMKNLWMSMGKGECGCICQ